jgi:acyl-CoA hydrolase
MTEMVLPQHTNALGSVFGGTVMCWVDIAAATCALRHCSKQVVTASVDALHFLAPIRLGWIVTIQASVNFVGGTSCEIGVKIISENPISGETFHTASAYLTFVALDSHNRPTSIPPLLLETDEERRRNSAAQIRRANRLKLKNELQLRKDP